ncbi:MAG: hypothetical protein A2X11_06370 [Bacteroidetes bacterium GWE2_42_24]|nr:MAG: hypothetical protein A2X11_06370 [Bacteroidetes bacterium GWE2_42_24]OFY25565.1 MAG: hypothetical protein A2X09_13305 [Bacteroidetes bacterium GWF2_43_11]
MIILIIAGCDKESNDPYRPDDELQQRLQRLVDSKVAAYKLQVPEYPGGLVLKVLKGRRSCFAASGMVGNVSGANYFRAASNTKTFTATAILLLYQQGRLNLNHRITDTIPGTNKTYVPDGAGYDIPYKSSITILDLLRHRAGVYDLANETIPDTISKPLPYKGRNYIEYVLNQDSLHSFTFNELINVVAETGMSYFMPGTGYHYSNTGYSLLGKIIERVSNMTYQQYLTEQIILPMGLHHTSFPFEGNDTYLPIPCVQGFILDNQGVKDITSLNVSANIAEGNLITTPDDLAIFIQNLLKGKGPLSTFIVNSVMMNCLSSSSLTAGRYGCGLMEINNLGYGHTGAVEGYLSLMVSDPASDVTIIIYTNAWNIRGEMSSLIDQEYDLIENTAYSAKAIISEYSSF